MDTEKISTQMKKGVLEYIILSMISDKQVYANEIIETLKKHDLIVVEGTLYPLLNRLKEDNLLTYQWVESKSGPPRKYYSLTPNGKIVKNIMESVWSKLVSVVNAVNK